MNGAVFWLCAKIVYTLFAREGSLIVTYSVVFSNTTAARNNFVQSTSNLVQGDTVVRVFDQVTRALDVSVDDEPGK